MQNLLSNQALAISALDHVSVLLFPSLFTEACAQGHTEVLKAMVQAWPFPCLPLGILAESPDLDIFKAVLDGVDGLLAKKGSLSRGQLQLLELQKEHPDICIRGYQPMTGISHPDILTAKPTASRYADTTEEQPLVITMDLTIKNAGRDDRQAYLLKWASERKARVRLYLQKLHILSGSVSMTKRTRLVVHLNSVQGGRVNSFGH